MFIPYVLFRGAKHCSWSSLNLVLSLVDINSLGYFTSQSESDDQFYNPQHIKNL